MVESYTPRKAFIYTHIFFNICTVKYSNVKMLNGKIFHLKMVLIERV